MVRDGGREIIFIAYLFRARDNTYIFLNFILQIKKLRLKEIKEPADDHKACSVVKSGLHTRLGLSDHKAFSPLQSSLQEKQHTLH